MRGRLAISLVLAVVLAGALLGPANLAGAAPKPLVVGTDPADDWGANSDPTIAPAGGPLGMELTEASIGMGDKTTVNFIIKLAMLPPSGGVPELVRYTWDYTLNGQIYSLDGKFLNYSRGACDPTSGQCPPPRDPGTAPFMLRGKCGPHPVVTNFTACEELGLVHATFDAAAGTITIPVPLDVMRAKPGSKIQPGVNSTFGGSVVAIPSAFVSNATLPMDLLTITKTFVVPKK